MNSPESQAYFDAELADLLGDIVPFPQSPLDRPIGFTRFEDWDAKTKTVGAWSLRQMAERVNHNVAEIKAELPWIKLTDFGDQPTPGGCLRHNGNVLRVHGIEGDYDGEALSPAEGAARLRAAGIAALIYTSPSHRPDRPRWRVLAPLSKPHAPEARRDLCARLNGALGGILSSESFTLSQSYYFGRLSDSEGFETHLVDGAFLDHVEGIEPVAPASGGGEPLDELERELKQQQAEESFAEDMASGRLQSALAAIAEHGTGTTYTDPEWQTVVRALSHATRGSREGFDVWARYVEICPRMRNWAKDGEHKAAMVRRQARGDWNRYARRDHGRPVALGSLYHLAKAAGWAWEKPAPPATAPKIDPANLGLEWFHAATLPQATPYLVRDLLDQGAASVVYGPSNSGKTFFALDLAFHLATGKEWNGRKVKRAAVLYLALEGGTGIVKRIMGIRQESEIPRPIPFAYRRGGANLLAGDDKGDVAAIITMHRELMAADGAADLPSMIVIDTLSRSLSGGDENSPVDMTAFVGNVDRIREETGAHVLIVHHTGKDIAKGMRGHSSLVAAIDSEIEILRPDGGTFCKASVKKQRDHESDYDLPAFRLKPVFLGDDDEGNPVRTAVVDWCPDVLEDPRIADLGKAGKAAWNAARKLADESGFVVREALIAELAAHSISPTDKGRREYAHKAIRELTTVNLLSHCELTTATDTPEVKGSLVADLVAGFRLAPPTATEWLEDAAGHGSEKP
ncbi:MAG: AAA family ATPase [Amaricoccus sp.]